jgi:predicted transcriptional regulator of viral defense system
MAYRDTLEARRALQALAVVQGGYFTAKQALEAGYSYSHLAYHLKSSNFERAGQGLYRLPGVPLSEHDDLVQLALWSRDRRDIPQAVASHETALALHSLSEIIPPSIHLTVPRGVVLHKARLAPPDVEEREGFRVTTPLCTLLDVAAATTVSREQLAKAVADALERGLVRQSQLKAAIRTRPEVASRLADSRPVLK